MPEPTDPVRSAPAGSPTRCLSRKPPRNLAERDRWLFHKALQTTLPDRSVEVHQGVDAFGRGPLRAGDRVLAESFVGPRHLEQWRREGGPWRAAVERLFQFPEALDAPVVWITDNWSCGYYHWMCDALPRLELALSRRTASELTLLLPSKFRRHRYVAESLQVFGLKEVRILRRFQWLRCRELLLPSHVAPTGNYDETIMRKLRQRIRGFLQTDRDLHTDPGAAAPRRLYISRRAATRRRIANEAEILPVLADHGFVTVVAEQYPWRRQVELAAGATALVSNHGAGLTNMMVMSPGARVMEIRAENDDRLNCYFSLASAAELDYHYLLARRQNVRHSVHRADLLVDPDRLDEQLTRMLGSRSSVGAAAA